MISRFWYRPIQFSILPVALLIQHDLILQCANITLVPKILILLLARHLNKLADLKIINLWTSNVCSEYRPIRKFHLSGFFSIGRYIKKAFRSYPE